MLRRELRPMLALAAPVVIAEVGWVLMGTVDTLMVGRLGASAIAAAGLAAMLFFTVMVFSMGLLLGLDPLVAQAFGAGRLDECHRWLGTGVWLALIVSLPSVGLILLIRSGLVFWGLPPDVLALTQPYLSVLAWSLPPLLLYVAFRRYLQAMNIVRPVTIALVAANVVNAMANWILIFGHLGAPALGVRGSAFATLGARIFMAAALFAVILAHEARMTPRLRETPLGLDPARIRTLVRLGLPAAGQVLFEVGVFALATALAGRVSASGLAANQIALNMASLTFMVPYGIGSAGAVRVGHAVGRRDARGAREAGWTAITIGVAFMAFAASLFFTFPGWLMRAFTHDASVIEIGIALLFVAAIFQLFDGLQGVTTGVLRGLGDTRSPMFWNLGGHWFVGLPLGYLLCFHLGRGVVGLWWGLSVGLMICGVALLIVWIRKGTVLAPLAAGGAHG
ncbi:MAG TPA: MATE family efflux transporter [Vicinamibacterales bacterium]|jgi:MATE family multidrug resistance protein|nr:MATE family efflux transporter [Vicinamibacterales bacterium]